MPLFDGFLGGAGQDRRAANDAEILDHAVPADQCLENDGALYLHLAGQKRIAGLHGPTHDFGGVGGDLHVLGGFGGEAGCRVGCVACWGVGDWMRRRVGLEIDSH